MGHPDQATLPHSTCSSTGSWWVRNDVPVGQPGHRGGPRVRPGRVGGRRAGRRGRRPARVRRDLVVDRRRVPRPVPGAAARGADRAQGGAARADDRRRGRAAPDHLRRAARRADRDRRLLRQAAVDLRVHRGDRRSRSSWAPSTAAGWSTRPRASSPRSSATTTRPSSRWPSSRPALAAGLHRRAEGRAADAADHAGPRGADRQRDRDPAGRRQHPLLLAGLGRRGAHHVAGRGRRHVHRLHRHRPPDHGGRRPPRSSGSSSSSAASPRWSCSTTPT